MAICFLSFLLVLRRVINSLLLREKVAAVRLTDEESLLVGTPHPPPSREPPKLDKLVSENPVAVPLPPLGKAFLYTRKVRLFFLTSTAFVRTNANWAKPKPF